MYETRQAICHGKEQEAENRAQQVYGENYSPILMFDSKKAVSRTLNEKMKACSDRENTCGKNSSQRRSRKNKTS